MNKKILSAILAVMILGSVLVGSVAASQTQTVNGDAVNSTDQTNTTYISTAGEVDNFTVNMSEDQSVPTGGIVFYDTNVTPASAELNSSSGSGTLTTTVVDDGVYVNETSTSSSATLESLHVTFNASDNVTTNGNVSDAVNYTSAMSNASTLIQDSDGSEVHEYRVVDPMDYVDVESEVVGPAGGEMNLSEYNPNSTGEEVQIVFDVTRNNTSNENISLEKLHFEAGLHKSYFTNISETTDTNSTTGPVLKDVRETRNNTTKVYAFDLVRVNNTTDSWTVSMNATVQSGSPDDGIVYGVTQDPEGGIESSSTGTIALAAGSGTGPMFFGVAAGGVPTLLIGGIFVVVVLGGFQYSRNKDSQMAGYGLNAGLGKNLVFVALPVTLGGSMVADWLSEQFNFWTNMGIDPVMAGIIGTILTMIGIGMVVREYRNDFQG